MDLTYAEIGATRDAVLPAGYRHVHRRARIGTGERVFAAAVEGLRGFGMQARAGLAVRAQGPVSEGVEVAVGLGIGPARLWAPCRVVWVIDEPGRYGYGYGTLPGHPERGEEAFLLTLGTDGSVWFEIKTFSRPARWFVSLGGPVSDLVQSYATTRYVRALRQLATRASPPAPPNPPPPPDPPAPPGP
jgi:uncharacterized protein (UPF0548 family)